MPGTGSSPIIFSQPVPDLVRRRFSCRSYAPEPIGEQERRQLEEALAAVGSGPLGSPLRFRLIAATAEDNQSLRGLGTYGFIHGATGFIIGAAPRSQFFLEDYGYRLEQIILLATSLGLGTCWLGGTFTQSNFAAKISRTKREVIPAVAAIGRIADPEQARTDGIRRLAGSDRRLPWNVFFFRIPSPPRSPAKRPGRTPDRWRWSGWAPPPPTSSPGGSSARATTGTFTCSGRRDTAQDSSRESCGWPISSGSTSESQCAISSLRRGRLDCRENGLPMNRRSKKRAR
ncbi:MAG: nitroreductase family protein [Anaerolineales bacterium]